MISLHTSPLQQPGSGDSGGMNVYVREVASALAQAGVECTTYTRADRPGLAPEVQVEPGHRVVHVPAGPFDLPKEALPAQVEPFTAGVLEHLRAGPGVDVVHGNYWLSASSATTSSTPSTSRWYRRSTPSPGSRRRAVTWSRTG